MFLSLPNLHKGVSEKSDQAGFFRAKSQSVGIANALEEGVKLGASLDQQRDAYRPLARKGSLLFFLLRDLRAANHMLRPTTSKECEWEREVLVVTLLLLWCRRIRIRIRADVGDKLLLVVVRLVSGII